MPEIRIKRTENRCFMEMGGELIELSDYNLKSSADGTTELAVVIKSQTNLFEMSANLIELKK